MQPAPRVIRERGDPQNIALKDGTTVTESILKDAQTGT